MSQPMIQCVYASTSGNTESVVEYVATLWRQLGIEITLQRAEQTTIDLISSNQVFLFATSTWEHGALNPFFAPLAAEMEKTNLAGKQAAFIGLGDQRYEPVLFCEGMEKVRKIWLDRGGEQKGEALKIQGEPFHQLESVVRPWAEKTLSELMGVGQVSHPDRKALLQRLFKHA